MKISQKIFLSFLLLIVGVLLSACGNQQAKEDVLSAAEIETAKEVYVLAGCGACHQLDSANTIGGVGPQLNDIGLVAGTRQEGVTAETYLREAILQPNAFVAPDCPGGPCSSPSYMPATISDKLNEENLNLLVRYLLTMKAQPQIDQ
ncbi:MAG TPA: c-type cytochrome [Anaerolineales bacterium]|nr:c-type cytochrome [Anaerolineales bacterium]